MSNLSTPSGSAGRDLTLVKKSSITPILFRIILKAINMKFNLPEKNTALIWRIFIFGIGNILW